MQQTPLDPPGPELAAKNRRLLAERLGWPDGALEACEQLDQAHIGWYTNWSPGGSPSRPDTCNYAQRWRQERGEPLAYGKPRRSCPR
jgi:hypothetical protein